MKLLDWNGHEMEVERSRGGVLAACWHYRNLIQRASAVGESTEIIQKLVRSKQESAFDTDELARLQEQLGYYCDLQSLHSEDAITWSVFGTVGHCEEPLRVRWVRELFWKLGLPSDKPDHCEITLWRRVPHPETGRPEGPEIDFSIVTEDTVLLGESKWLAGIGKGQGIRRNKDQIQLRIEFLKDYGKSGTFLSPVTRQPEFKNMAVFLVGLEKDPSFIEGSHDGIELRFATWEQVCSLKSHPFAQEVGRYYRWKLEHTHRIGWTAPEGSDQ